MTQTQSMIDTSEILYIEPDKKRTNNWLTRTGLQLPFGVTNYGSIKSVTYPERNFNTYYANNSENDTEEIYSMDYSEASEDGKKVSKVYDNSIMGKGTYKGIQSAAEARVAEFMYDGISNKETYEAAQKRIESSGIDAATRKILAKAAGAEAWTADDTASALALMAHHQTEGDVVKVSKLSSRKDYVGARRVF